jgi:nicotinic acid mononucleotide adenylyltransferase
VVSRPGVLVAELPARLGRLRTAFAETADRSAVKTSSADGLTMIFLIDAVTADVSSTGIRRYRAEGKSIAGMVPPAVQQHIEQHALYDDTMPMTETGTGAIGRRAGRLHGQD